MTRRTHWYCGHCDRAGFVDHSDREKVRILLALLVGSHARESPACESPDTAWMFVQFGRPAEGPPDA